MNAIRRDFARPLGDTMRDYTEEELKILSDMLPNIALQLRTSLATVYTAVDRLVPADMREKDAKTDRTAGFSRRVGNGRGVRDSCSAT